MKSLMLLLQSVLADASTWCCASTTRDYSRIACRVEHEGLSFLTITLPAFCRDFETSLREEQITPVLFPGFGKRGQLPKFLGGLMELVFDRFTGRLLGAPDHLAIFYIRQITLMYKKILLPCSSERERNAYDCFIKCENEVEEWSLGNTYAPLMEFRIARDLLWNTDLSFIDRKVYEGSAVPRHGPGSTADKLFGNEKYQQRTWHSRLEEFFPSEQFLIPNWGFHEELGIVDFVEPGDERPVKVVSVPKTLKTPRIIAIEPTCMQYAQQAILEMLVDRLERSNHLMGSIGFTDQTPNQRLALKGSLDGSLATLDLSEASDRVSNLLVLTLLENFRTLSGAVQACRSLSADVPGFGVKRLSKFASMGSALCFPMEAMVFLTICLVAKIRELNRPITKKELKSFLQQVRIYGDDIIVPVELARPVSIALSDFGLKVNTHKSFWTGKFRESCGRDYYAGTDVTVTYVRRMFPETRGNVSEVVSLVALRNQLYKAGLWHSVEILDDQLRGLAPLPTVQETSPVLGRHSFLGTNEPFKFCPDLHIPLVKGMVVVPVPRSSPLDDSGALLKFFLKRGENPFFDAKHLERYGRPESVDIKIRWAPTY